MRHSGKECGSNEWWWFPAPAKINRFLRILGRRDDGYHRLQTLYQFLEHGDWVGVRWRGDGELRLQGSVVQAAGGPPEHDLCLRAAHALRSMAPGPLLGADIRLLKRLPIGAGLGGGSSDAATTLLALDWLWGLDRSVTSLLEIGLRLGADVPVFVAGKAAFGEGIGEVLTDADPDCPAVWLVDCGEIVMTAELFAAPDLHRAAPALTLDVALLAALERAPRDARFDNVFEAPVAARHPRIEAVLAAGRRHARHAFLTGSGGACIVQEVRAERPLSEELAALGCRVTPTRLVNRSTVFRGRELAVPRQPEPSP